MHINWIYGGFFRLLSSKEPNVQRRLSGIFAHGDVAMFARHAAVTLQQSWKPAALQLLNVFPGSADASNLFNGLQ